MNEACLPNFTPVATPECSENNSNKHWSKLTVREAEQSVMEKERLGRPEASKVERKLTEGRKFVSG